MHLPHFFRRDHFILGCMHNGILYIKNGNCIAFDSMKRMGYDSSLAISKHNNLFKHARAVKLSLFAPLRKNFLLSPLFTVVCSTPLNQEEVVHFHEFCKLMGGVKITISLVSSVKDFLDKPNMKLVKVNYIQPTILV